MNCPIKQQNGSTMVTLLDDAMSIPVANNGVSDGMRGKPDWFKVRMPNALGNNRHRKISKTLRDHDLFTVCEEARCPNQLECWSGGTATFMIMGEVCTRACRFCAVKTGNPLGQLDEDEPENLAKAIAEMKLDYAVITSVDRDDLPDGGAYHFAECIRQCRKHHPELIVEVLTPDFAGDLDAVKRVAEAKPHVFAHNIETVERLQGDVRDRRAGYEQTLKVLEHVKKLDPKTYTKSSIMLGFGEKEEEVVQTMHDLRNAGVDIFTLGQYLRPSRKHIEVQEFVHPKIFAHYKEIGEKEIGFAYVASGPFVRSSYKAAELFVKSGLKNKRT
jgi:lipoyl synthase